MKTPNILNPTKLANAKLAQRYARHPGPYAITDGWQDDLNKLFPGIMDIHFDIDAVGRPAYGEMNESETELLYRIVKWLEPKVLVELGTFKGRSTRIMAEQSPLDARVLTVDLPAEHNFKHPYSTDPVFTELASPGSGYNGSPAEGKITQLRMDATSDDFLAELDRFRGDKHIDFALIDAAHDYYTTKRLFERIYPRMSKGGVIFTDDYNKLTTHVGVTEFFAEKARADGFVFYHFKPSPSNAKDPSAMIFLNVDGAVRDWRTARKEE